MRLAGKTALVTGGARGIGLAFVEAYLREGARVVIADVGGAQEAAARLGDKALGVTMDVTDQASIDAGVKAAADWGGGIDILLNNAAIFDLAPIVDITRASYDKIFAVNVAGTLFPLQAVAKVMIAQGRGGKIINMASQAGRRGEAL
ncbi:MAG: SDR family NAD(P)-dependent oxidoreductase, partial [Tabrizicola sp.]